MASQNKSSCLGHHQTLFLILTILAGIIILYPNLDFHQYIVTGDHGRDLYSFKKTFEGAVPYRDYWSQNGPLMPYYYSAFYHLFGVSIQSTLLGYNLLILLTGIFVYLICRSYIDPVMSFACALWYWAFRGTEFFYTFNHIGAVFLVLVVIFFLFEYIKNSKNIYIYLGALSLLFLAFIRPSIGASSLIAFFASLSITSFTKKDPFPVKKSLRYLFISFCIIVMIFLLYRSLTHNLPLYVSSRDLAYWKYIKWSAIPEACSTLKGLFLFHFTSTWPRRIFGIFLLLTSFQLINLLRNDSINKAERTQLSLAMISLFIFFVLNLSEFMVSAVWFRYLWALTPLFLIIFFIMDGGTRTINKSLKNMLSVLLISIAFISIFQYQDFIASCKIPANRLNTGANKVYLTSHQQGWIQTVSRVTDFIIENVPQDQKIAAIPYDPLYYFLSNRDSGMWELATFTREGKREENAILQIEENKVNYIIFSNRAVRPVEKRFGVFGKTYGLRLAQHLNENFEVVATFGPWEWPGGWFVNHAVKIYKRKI